MQTKVQHLNLPNKLIGKPTSLHSSVLILDSGVGGLSIYAEIRRLLPNLHYIFTFDNVAFPYGERDEAFIVERVVKIVSAIQRKYALALAIIACNTASMVSLPSLREKFHFPVVGVVPAIKPAARLTVNGIIGLLSTRGTAKCFYTRNLIDRFANECQIHILGSSELVEIAEAKIRGEVISLDELRLNLLPFLCMPEVPDTIVLGCTHFPLLKEELLQLLPKGTRLLDSSAAIAKRTICLLKHKTKNFQPCNDNIVFCLSFTKDTEKLLPIFRRYGFETLNQLFL